MFRLECTKALWWHNVSSQGVFLTFIFNFCRMSPSWPACWHCNKYQDQEEGAKHSDICYSGRAHHLSWAWVRITVDGGWRDGRMCSRKRFWVQDVRVVGKNFELSNYLPSVRKNNVWSHPDERRGCCLTSDSGSRLWKILLRRQEVSNRNNKPTVLTFF